ncbi:MAG: hypothetical protein V1874_14270 [Spirochaetota bacterium]
MKIIKKYFIAFISLLFISQCSGNGVKKNPDSNNTEKVSVSNISIKDKSKIKAAENTGKIEVQNDAVYFVVNWTSRSRKTLKVIGDMENEMKSLNNKIIEADGKITYTNQWSGTIDIKSYKVKE